MANGNGNGKPKNSNGNGHGNGNGNGEKVCGALLKQCRECAYKFSAEDTANHVDACPNCGTERGRCTSKALFPNGRCKLHAGMAVNGIAHPMYQGKGYSKYLPPRIKDDYEEALNDPALIELRSEMALVEARMGAVLRQLGTGEAGVSWRAAQKSMQDLLTALQLQDADGQTLALNGLRSAIDKGAGDYALWNELRDLIETKRKLTDSEARRTIAAKQFVTLEKFGLVFDALITVVKDNVEDRSTLARIQRGLYSIYAAGGNYELAASEPDADRDERDN
jgi:hypothetical protein